MHMQKFTTMAAATLLGVGASVFGAAIAQQAPAASPAQQAEVQSVIKEYREVSSELQGIRKKAVAENPDITKQQETFRNRVVSEMKSEGYDVEAKRESIKEMGTELRGEEVADERRKELIGKLRAEQQEMRQAQKKVMQKPEIQAKAEELNDATLEAMREQNPKTDDLLARMKELRGELQAMAPAQGGGR
ncbi:MAG: hypothetical protein RJQ08_06615 [Salinisphaeraceae bacterium]